MRIRLNGRLKPNSSTAVLNNYELQNCRDAPTAKASAKYVANHHFQPEILQAMLDQGKTNIDCLPVQLIKDLGLIDNGYTNADLFHGKVPDADGKTSPVYVPVPSYKNAEDDYKSVSNRWRLNRIIKDCRMKRRGKSTLAPRGQDNILRPVDKRAKIDALPAIDSESVDDLQRAVCMLSDELDAANEKIKRLEDESKLKDLLSREGLAYIERLSKETMGGLTRMNITSDDYHRRHKNVAKNLFGFEDRTKGGKLSSWDITKQFIKDMWDVNHVEPTISTILDDSGRKKSMSKFEQVLITLMWFQNLHDHSYLASIWGCSKDIIGTTIKWWAPHFYEVGCQLARLPLDEEFMKKSYPQSYLDLNFPAPVASVVDGTDVLCQSVRKHRAVNVIQRSNKIEHSAFRGVTWSLPMGTVHEFTDPFFARASEKALVRLWAGHGRFKDIPIGLLISGDKGFDQTSVFYPHYNQILHPAFLTGGDKAQFSEKQIGWNRKACEKRYTSEVVFARFKKYGGMGQILERHSFHYVHYLWDGRMAWQILDISHCRHQQTRITFPNRSTAVNKYNI